MNSLKLRHHAAGGGADGPCGPPLEILTQVRNGLPDAMFEQVASTLGLSTSALAAKLGIARRTVIRKRGSGAPLSSEASASGACERDLNDIGTVVAGIVNAERTG
jgi:hypothetical protein